ncbi:hypothetical protein EPN95_01445 [Patescibacteria group bacterium]|nr:MAG: hypothetical protein EPN95_01445 [Patescibacteria group bacterium]
MFETFTTQSHAVVDSARAIAVEMNHGYIGTEHILHGLSSAGVAGGSVINNALLVASGLSKTAIRDGIATINGGVHNTVRTRRIAFSPGGKTLWDMAVAEAVRRRDPSTRPEHILYVLVREANRSSKQRAGKVIRTVAPNLNLVQVLTAIDDLLLNDGRAERVIELDVKIARDTLALNMVKTVRHMHLYLQHNPLAR